MRRTRIQIAPPKNCKIWGVPLDLNHNGRPGSERFVKCSITLPTSPTLEDDIAQSCAAETYVPIDGYSLVPTQAPPTAIMNYAELEKLDEDVKAQDVARSGVSRRSME
ncbi:hypothetical protein WG66_010905 [Moniliophthora roreri]|nr:hypothetical protein WG66_010905 [Moniliophthora roreri]